ncbi:MAG: DUF4040 domain-containing protein [Planctomycetota bacterium]
MVERADLFILGLLVATALVIVRARSLWAAVMLTGAYSFLSASWMMLLDAPDVAFTEASVGAGVATVLMLGTLSLVGGNTRGGKNRPLLPLAVVTLTGAALIYGTLDLPRHGDPDAIIHRYPDPSYVEVTEKDVQIPNVVTAVLASYRGYDTLGETTVVFTAAVAVLLLLRARRPEDEGETGA